MLMDIIGSNDINILIFAWIFNISMVNLE